MNDNSTPHATHVSGANQAGSFSISAKPPLTYGQQVDLMVSRGLSVEDETEAALELFTVNYYRLRWYWLTYERDGPQRKLSKRHRNVLHLGPMRLSPRRCRESTVECLAK